MLPGHVRSTLGALSQKPPEVSSAFRIAPRDVKNRFVELPMRNEIPPRDPGRLSPGDKTLLCDFGVIRSSARLFLGSGDSVPHNQVVPMADLLEHFMEDENPEEVHMFPVLAVLFSRFRFIHFSLIRCCSAHCSSCFWASQPALLPIDLGGFLGAVAFSWAQAQYHLFKFVFRTER